MKRAFGLTAAMLLAVTAVMHFKPSSAATQKMYACVVASTGAFRGATFPYTKLGSPPTCPAGSGDLIVSWDVDDGTPAPTTTTTTTTTTVPPTTTTTTTTTTTVPPTTTTTTTVPPGGLNGWDMNASNTGPTGTLTPQACNITITTPGTTMSNFRCTSGSIGIKANNVTLTNFQIDNGHVWCGSSANNSQDAVAVTGAHVDHGLINGGGGTNTILDVGCSGAVFEYLNLTNAENFVTLWGANGQQSSTPTVQYNYMHDEFASGAPHYDGVEVYGFKGGSATISRNWIELVQSNGATAPVNLTPTGSFVGTVTVDRNYMTSQNCAYVILGDDSQGSTNITAVLTNNRLDPSTPDSWCGSAQTPKSYYFSLRNSKGSSTYSVSGNVDSPSLTAINAGSCRTNAGVQVNCP